MILDTEIRGIPCKVRVIHYEPALEPILYRSIDWCDPGSPAEVEFVVLDRHGRAALWLERQMDDADTRAVEQEIIAAMESEHRQAMEGLAEDKYLEEHA